MNDAMGPEIVNRIRDVLTSGECSVPERLAKEPMSKISSSSSPSSLGDAKKAGDNDDDDDDEDDDDIDEEKTDTRSDKNSSIVSDPKGPLAVENSVNLSGPVTDL
ncbi:nucleophosmin-like isoform X2 [Ooceraea biroi]|uniref:Uncharacterized protein n=2 Tax=Ooceraea biroi TaxID=2015173 RepID=A0A026WSK4_OOCBI|nr:nucleophosmin-like isoform X2 [Ooceraea biroi]EZA58616.1 hypothetical protein X777_14785 [Ooceraea biroi]